MHKREWFERKLHKPWPLFEVNIPLQHSSRKALLSSTTCELLENLLRRLFKESISLLILWGWGAWNSVSINEESNNVSIWYRMSLNFHHISSSSNRDAHRHGLNERGRQSGRAQQQNSEHLKILISTQLQGVLEATKATRFTRSMQHHIFLSELAVGCFCRQPFLPFSKRTSPKTCGT